jgi:integrase
MTKKFNSKTYAGKPRIYVSVPRAPRISRLWIWNKNAKEYRAPENGKPYMVGRYETDSLGTRKRRYQFFSSVEEARVWQSGVETSPVLPTETEKPKVRSGPLFRDLIEEWKRRRFPQLAHGTRLQYEKILKLYMWSLFDLSIYEITPQRVDEWLDSLKAPDSPAMRRKTRQSFEHELTLLTTLLKYYFDYHDDPNFQMPVKQRHRDAVRLKRDNLVTTRHKNLLEEDFCKFREFLRKEENGEMWEVLATVQYYQALRISEAAGLHWEDVHFDGKTPSRSRVAVVRSIFWPHQTGLPSYERLGFKNAEANGGVKEQPLFRETFEVLKSLHLNGAKGLIFQINGKHLEYTMIKRVFTRAFRRAGLPFSATHIMRHGGCRRVLNQERGDLGVAQQLLGNTSLKTTLIYAQRDPMALVDVAQRHWENSSRLPATACKSE